MNKILFLMYYLLITVLAFSQTPGNDPHWKLNWQDNFDSFDNSRWVKAKYANHGSTPALFIEQNVRVENGHLVIEANSNKDTCPTPPPWPDDVPVDTCTRGKQYNFTTGWVETTEEYCTQFGYIEAKIKLPQRSGVGYAFWTFVGKYLPHSKNAAEIDVFEKDWYQKENELFSCVHTCYPDPIYDPDCIKPDHRVNYSISGFDCREWHTYAIEWNADRIIWYIDSSAVRTLRNYDLDSYGNTIINPVRIIFNTGIHHEHFPVSPFSEKMLVDYVKVYSLKCDKNKVVNEISNFNAYNYAVKKSITMSNATNIPANSNITLRATDFIELKPGFEVQTGRELYLDVTPCISDCVENLTNQTITSNATYTGCDILNVKDVDILNSAKVDITAGESVVIKPGFRAAAGTEVRVGVVSD